jgi:hypothetical protein
MNKSSYQLPQGVSLPPSEAVDSVSVYRALDGRFEAFSGEKGTS